MKFRKILGQNTDVPTHKKTLKHDISEFINITHTKKQKQLYPINVANYKTGYINQTGGSGEYTTKEKLFGKTYSEIPPEFYFVKSKKDYAQRARDVRASWINIAIQRKLGRMREQEYLMFKALLRANLYFARFNLYFEKLTQLTIILNHGNASLIEDARHSMNLIFSYQKEIQNELSLKVGKKGINPKDVEKIVKKQDKERNKLFDTFVFKNSYDLIEGCKGILGVPKNKKFLCILSKYRKVEAKFNKYFGRFRDEIKAFFTHYQGCSGNSKAIDLQLLDISGFEKQKETFVEQQTCESFAANAEKDKILSKALMEDSTRDLAIKEKHESVSTKFKQQMGSLDDMMKAFNKKIIEINQRFQIMEYYGLHRYAGMKPQKKRLFQAILGEKGYQVINPKRLAKLSMDPDFIKHFEDVIKQIAEKSKNLVIPVDKSLGELIPIIHLDSSKISPTELTFLSMNMDGFKYGSYKLDDLYDSKAPAIICIQNGTQDMTLKTGSFVTGFLQGKYIPISFSIHRNVKYNIIFVKVELITPDPVKPDYIKNLQPANQSSRFVLNEFPTGMTWENNGRSYTVANFVFDDAKGSNKTGSGICVVCTELVGSNADDMFFANKVRDFVYTRLDGRQGKGLRGAQITRILKMVESYNGTLPDFVLGDMGGMYQTSSSSKIPKLGEAIKSGVATTYQETAWNFFKKKHPDLVQYFLEDPVSGKGNINDYLSNGFNDALEKYIPYTIEINTAVNNITKSIPPLISSYIFSKGAIGTNNSTTTHTQSLISDIIKLGGNIPISLSFDVSKSMSNLSSALQGRSIKSIDTSSKSDVKSKLFTEEELQNILRVIDNLMGNFAFGGSPYLRRDLGCLSLRNGGTFSNREPPTLYDKKAFGTSKSLLKIPINKIKFSHLDHVANYPENEVGINQLKDLYCQELPSIIDTYLFQSSGNFSKAAKLDEFYSVNQTTSSSGKMSLNKFSFPTKLKILSEAEEMENPEDKLLTPDIAIRLFLMPRRHLKLVMGIDLEKHGASNLRKLTTIALENFYATYATSRLEGRLSEILQSHSSGSPSDASLSAKPSYNILSHLLEKTADGHLSNINNGNAILDLFEIIFIFLRLKFIDRQVELYNIKTKEEQKEQTKLEKTVIHSIKDKSIAGNLFDTISNLLSTTTDSLNKLLYNMKITRKDPQTGEYLIQKLPIVEKDPDSVFGVIAKGYKKTIIQPRPISELVKQKLLGLQFMESFLSNELGSRLERIANILEHQAITPESQDAFKKKTNLAEGFAGVGPADYELANLEANILLIHQATQVAEPKEVTIANDILARCRTILQNINLINNVWQEYFVNVIRILEHYNQTILLLVLFENNEENPPRLTKANILDKLKSIFRDTTKARENIIKLPFQLSKDVDIIFEQIEQIKAHIENPNKFKKDNLELSFLNALELPKDKSIDSIQAQYEPNIHDIQLRTAYLIFNRIISRTYPQKTPESTAAGTPSLITTLETVDYTEIQRLCDLLEIGYYNFNRRHHLVQKGGSGSGNVELLKHNYEILVNISRYLWIAIDILEKGNNSYDIVAKSSSTTKPKIELSKLLNDIVTSLSSFNDIVTRAPHNKELCGYIIRPLGLLIDFAYHITNAFTSDSSKTFELEQLITEPEPSNPESSLNALYTKLKYLLGKGSEITAVNTARSNADITTISSNLPTKMGSLSSLMDYGLIGKTTMEAVKGLKIYEEYVLHDEIMQLQSDKILDVSSTSVSVNYNEFKMDNLKTMEKLDEKISFQIRNLQANDYCNNSDAATKLENEVQITYKPSIFKLDVGSASGTSGDIQDNIMDKTDNSMLYLFLDVIDYCKNNKNSVSEIYDSTIKSIEGLGINLTTEPFSSVYEKNRIISDSTTGFVNNKIHTDFNENLHTIFKNRNNLNDNVSKYIARGSNLGELANNFDGVDNTREYNNFLFLLYNLLYLKRFTITQHIQVNTALPDNGFISIIYGATGTMRDENKLTDGKKFCINYFIGNEIDFDENMYIDLKFLRRYFLKVIYENFKLVDTNNLCLEKNSRINLILTSAFALSYLLNHNPIQPKKQEEIKEFAFILLGISTLKNYTPALYFKIGAIINTPVDSQFKWADKFVSYFLKDKVSYYFPKVATDIIGINNDTVLAYLKSLCVCKSNLFARDIYNDSNPEANNCMKVMGFINTARSLKTEKINAFLEVIYLIKRLEVLIGTKDKGLLHDYQQKYNFELNAGAGDKGLPHLFSIIDYLNSIGFFDIIGKINSLLGVYGSKLEFGIELKPDIHSIRELCKNEYSKIRTYLDGIKDNMQNNKKNKNLLILELLLLCFNIDRNLLIQNNSNQPLYYFRNLFNAIMDCMAFALEYYIPSNDEIADFNNKKYLDKMTGIFNMILDIFNNELNTLLRPYFALKIDKEQQDDEKRIDLNKSIIAMIKDNLEALVATSATGKLPDYTIQNTFSAAAPVSSDLEIFDFINRLLTCRDKNGNYYAIGDTNILESYLSKPEIKSFISSITSNGYLFNDIQVSLNTKYFSDIFTNNDELEHKTNPTGGAASTYAPPKKQCPYFTGTTNNDMHIYTHNKKAKFEYFNNKIFNKMKDLFINYFTYFGFYSDSTPVVNNDFYHNNTKQIELFIQGIVNQGSTTIDATKQSNLESIKKDYNATVENELKNNYDFGSTNWNKITKAINGGEDGTFNIKSIICDITGAGELHQIIGQYFKDILIAQAEITSYGPTHKFTKNPDPRSDLQKLIFSINQLYFDNSIDDYNKAQGKIKEIHRLFNTIMESLDGTIKSLKNKSGNFEYSRNGTGGTDYDSYAPAAGAAPPPPKLAFITPTLPLNLIDNRLENYGKIDNLLQREYWHIEDFFDGIKDCLLDLISLVPMPLNSNYVNPALIHRNNLFIATSALGYMNMRNIEYSLRYNVYTNVKLRCYELLKGENIPDYFGVGKGLQFYATTYKLLEEYFRKVNILEDINKGSVEITNNELKANTKEKSKEFLQLRLNKDTTSVKEHIAKNLNNYQWSRIYTHPYFNYNSTRESDNKPQPITEWGTGGKEINNTKGLNFSRIIANQLTKHTLLHFIKYNFNRISTLDNYGNTIHNIIDNLKLPNKIPFYENWEKVKNYISSASGNAPNMKNILISLFNSWYKLLKEFNDSNRQLISDITVSSPISLSTSRIGYLEIKGAIDSNVFNEKYVPKLLALFNNTINIARVREYADKFLRDGLFMYLLYYNLVNNSQYNIPVNKYYKAKASAPAKPNFINFIYCYLEGFSKQNDIDNTNLISNIHIIPKYFDAYENEKQTIQEFISASNKPNNYAEERRCLNPDFYKVISKFIGHMLTHYKSATTTPVIDMKYAHKYIIGADGNIFYGSDIFALADKILSLESKSFMSRKESLVHELYKNLELTKYLREFSAKYKNIYNTSSSSNIVLAGGNPLVDVSSKTRKYKSSLISKSDKLTLIIKRYNDKTKKNLFQAIGSCNCTSRKHRNTKKLTNL